MARKPNILLITTDQQHWNTIGAFNGEVRTPCLDRMAGGGTVFTRAYCTNPTCTPDRASIITGQYPSQHKAYSLGTKLPEDEHTVGEYLSAAGYRTALIGKAHFQPLASTPGHKSLESYPILQDLDFWRGFKGGYYGFEIAEMVRNHTDEGHVGQHYAVWMEEKGFKRWKECFREPGGVAPAQKHRWNLPEKYHYNAWIAERTAALLELFREKNDNFFLWASFPDPHPPYLAPVPWDSMYDPRRLNPPGVSEGEHANNPPHFRKTQEKNPDFSAYAGPHPGKHGLHGFWSHLQSEEDRKKNMAVYYGMISLADKYAGKILDKLEQLGLKDDTVVVFTSDHGHFFGQHGLIAKGAFHYEDMIRVPLIVSWPGKVPGGRVCASLQSHADLAPTFLSICGLKKPGAMTGVDQSGVWLGGKEPARDHVVCENRHEPDTVNLRTYVDERYKITVYFRQDYGELFDLHRDPDEKKNLWDDPDRGQLKQELLLKFLWAEMEKEPLWMPRIANA